MIQTSSYRKYTRTSTADHDRQLRMAMLRLFLVLFSWLASALIPARPASAEPLALPLREVTLQEDTSRILNNPGIGWESNNRVLQDYEPGSDLPPSRIAYFKYYLKTFLHEDGMIDATPLQRDLKRAHDSGQRLAFRLMIFSEEEGGDILRSFGASRGTKYRYDDGEFKGPELWAPDLDDPIVLGVLRRLTMKLGRYFDGDPDLQYVDIGYVGLWGEWHTSDTTPKLRMPSFESQRAIVDMFSEAFPKTIKLMQLQSAEILKYALSKGSGIRADCLAHPSTTMMKLYPLTLLAAEAQESWKHAPFIFEICWTLDDWIKRAWDPSSVLDDALIRYHASSLNTKSEKIPAAIRPAFDTFLRRAGYRFFLSRVSFPAAANRGSPLQIATKWANRGVAPCYSDFRLAMRLRDVSGKTTVLPTGTQLCGKDAQEFSLPAQAAVPMRLSSGNYQLEVAVVEGSGLTPAILLANTNEVQGWYPVGPIHIE